MERYCESFYLLFVAGLFTVLHACQVGFGVTSDKSFTVVGAQLLESYYQVYDRDAARVGFARVHDCTL